MALLICCCCSINALCYVSVLVLIRINKEILLLKCSLFMFYVINIQCRLYICIHYIEIIIVVISGNQLAPGHELLQLDRSALEEIALQSEILQPAQVTQRARHVAHGVRDGTAELV